MSEGAIDTSGIIDKALLRKARSNLGGASLITFIRRLTRSKLRKDLPLFRHARVSSTYPRMSGDNCCAPQDNRCAPQDNRCAPVGNTFGFPFSQRLWLLYVKS